MKYTVKHAYSSQRDGKRFGPWAKGDVVELDEHDAEWVLRDSPGSLEEPNKPTVPARNRQQTPRKTRGK